MKKEHRTNRRYSAEFKIRAISDMRTNHLGYDEIVYKYWDVKNSVETHNHLKTLKLWERIYLEEGESRRQHCLHNPFFLANSPPTLWHL